MVVKEVVGEDRGFVVMKVTLVARAGMGCRKVPPPIGVVVNIYMYACMCGECVSARGGAGEVIRLEGM